MLVVVLLTLCTARRADAGQPADAHALEAIFEPAVFANNVETILAEAAERPLDARYEYLKGWVLPGASHASFRVVGGIVQTDPSPLARATVPSWAPTAGGAIVSPVYELLDTARELGRLEALRAEVESLPIPPGDDSRRSRVALLLLIDLERDDRESAAKLHEELYALVQDATPATTDEMWPETLVCDRAFRRPEHARIIGDLLAMLFSSRSERMQPGDRRVHHAQISALMGRLTELQQDRDGGARSQFSPEWLPMIRKRARSRGNGFPEPRWVESGDHLLHLPGHDEDYYLYRLPLRGNFEVQCDLGGWGTTQFLAAGTLLGAKGNSSQIEVGTFRGGSHPEEITPPLQRLDPWVRYRAVFEDDQLSIYLNGRLVRLRALEPHHDPWVGVRSWWRNPARVRDVRISGNPIIPTELELSASPELPGWYAYYDESVGTADARWRYEADPESTGQIVCLAVPELAGAHGQSLLRYHRPLVEGGSIEYEFRDIPGATPVHPALDRLVFLLHPDGVRVHWLTDGRYDTTGVSPDNVVDEPQHRRGPSRLPLKESDWNRLRMTIEGDVVRLELNGDLVYERPLESTNARTFGLFHDLGREARVRDVVLRGNWPSELPPHLEQELADPVVADLDARRDELEDVFTHDFAAGGLPVVLFQQSGRNNSLRTDSGGVLARATVAGGWQSTKILSRFAIEGDFDIEAGFDRLDVSESDQHGLAFIQVLLTDREKREYRSMRGRDNRQLDIVNGQNSVLFEDGQRRYFGNILMEQATSGTLRLVRRGDRMLTLFAPADSELFRLVHEEPAPTEPVAPGSIELTLATNGNGTSTVVWKDLTIRADTLKYVGPAAAPQRKLYVMRADGTDLRTVTGPAAGFAHLGSPEFSPDSRKIALDVSGGTISDSHVFVVNRDGTALTDLGRGCMPGFSADGEQLVISQPGQGIVQMDSDGENRRTIQQNGWGVQWSPDGRYIAWGSGNTITLLEVASGARRLLLTGVDAARYSSIYWNFGWSHDSRSIAFKGRSRRSGQYEVAVASIDDKAELEVLVTSESAMNADFTFSPDNRKVLFAMPRPGAPGPRLCLVSRDRPGELTWLDGLPDDWKVYDCDWSPDGKWIAFSAVAPQEPADWPLPEREMKALRDAARPLPRPVPAERGTLDSVFELFR
ncbi:DUF1583 domain-containing protein [Maioricimonas sp. JC845]|uniref:DUF1583 domain-containing protein n=1 Tax=Maioricimonas sp. JC845 TaxID=3232138 RepID=UPI003458CE0C